MSELSNDSQLLKHILEISVFYFENLINTKSGLSLLKTFNSRKLDRESPPLNELFNAIQLNTEKWIVEIAMNKYGVHLIASIIEVSI